MVLSLKNAYGKHILTRNAICKKIIVSKIYTVLIKYVAILNRAILWFISSKKVYINMCPKRLSEIKRFQNKNLLTKS